MKWNGAKPVCFLHEIASLLLWTGACLGRRGGNAMKLFSFTRNLVMLLAFSVLSLGVASASTITCSISGTAWGAAVRRFDRRSLFRRPDLFRFRRHQFRRWRFGRNRSYFRGGMRDTARQWCVSGVQYQYRCKHDYHPRRGSLVHRHGRAHCNRHGCGRHQRDGRRESLHD